MDICNGQKSHGTLGTEGTRIHQGTDEHLQKTNVSNIIVQVLFQDVSSSYGLLTPISVFLHPTFFSGHYKLHT